MNFPRRMFLALCLVALSAGAYYLFYHVPCMEEQQSLQDAIRSNKSAEDYKIISNTKKSKEAGVLELEIAELKSKALDLSTTHQTSEEEVLEYLYGIRDDCGIEDHSLSSCDEFSSTLKDIVVTERVVPFWIKGSIEDIQSFLMKMTDHKGLPWSWRLTQEEDENGNPFLMLCMEVKP